MDALMARRLCVDIPAPRYTFIRMANSISRLEADNNPESDPFQVKDTHRKWTTARSTSSDRFK